MDILLKILANVLLVVVLIAFFYICWHIEPSKESTTIITKYTFEPPEVDEIVITYKEDTDDNGKKVIEGEVKLLTKEDDATVEPRGGGPRAV